MMRARMCAAHAGVALLLLAATALAQSTTTASSGGRLPDTPTNFCANGVCSHQIKWNPGHYMASNGVIYRGTSLTGFYSEMDDLNNWNKILGYRAFVTWAALEPTQGTYDFSVIDALLARLKTHYNQPKRLVLVVLPGTFGGPLGTNDTSTLPEYIQTGSAYGPSPVAGSYGWWGATSGGKSSSSYVAALFRPAVMNRFIALIQALGAKYDSDPYFEALMIQENSWMVGSWLSASDYSDPSSQAQMERMLTAATTAFPHTSVVMENTWTSSMTSAFDFEDWMVSNRIAPGTSDTVGETAFASYGYSSQLAWGLQSYCGIANGGITPMDLRPRSHAMMDIEAPDIAGGYFSKYGGPYTPLDVINALNQTFKASHAFWTHLYGTETVFGQPVPAAAKWSNLAATLSANPLTSTSYPENYP